MIPLRYQNADIEKLSNAMNRAIESARGVPGKGIFIHGDAGTGKTYALYALSKTHNINVINWIDEMETLKTYMTKGWDIGEHIDELCKAKELGIDDLGAEKQTEYTQEKLYMIVNKMYNRMHRLFISTNLTPADFREKYGERLFSRIAEMCVVVELTGEDKRFN